MVIKILWGFFSQALNSALYFETEISSSFSLNKRSAVNAVSRKAKRAAKKSDIKNKESNVKIDINLS
jgi:hypothetical protein